MTWGATAPLKDYIEDGATVVHAVPFQFNDPSEVVCTRIAAGVEGLPLIQGAAYTVTGGNGTAGTVTKASGGVAGTIFRIKRVTPQTQSTAFTSGGSFPAKSVEKALDKDMAAAQETAVGLSLLEQRTIHGVSGDIIPALPAPASRASTFMQWASDGKSLLMLSASQAAQVLSAPIQALIAAIGKGDPGGNTMAIGLFIAAATLSLPLGTDMVRTSGYSTNGVGVSDYVSDAAVNSAYVTAHPRTSFISANGRGFRLVAPLGGFQASAFGAQGNSDATGATGDDDTAAITEAFSHVDGLGGGALNFHAGYFKTSSYFTLPKHVTVLGTGKRSSYIVTTALGGGGATPAEDLRNGSAFYSYWDPAGASVATGIVVRDMGFIAPSGANVGAAFYDSNGSSWQISRCLFQGYKYGAVLDYSELADISECDFQLQTAGGAGLWVVNGPSLTAGHVPTVTNRLSVSKCQFNQLPSQYCVLDEGGYSHSYIDNNYNGGLVHIFASGVLNLKVDGGEFESVSGEACIVLHYQRATDGAGVGGGFGEIANCVIVPGGAVKPCVKIYSATGVYAFRSNSLLCGVNVIPIQGAANAPIVLSGNLQQNMAAEIVDSFTSVLRDDRVDRPVMTNFSLASLAIIEAYAEKFVECINPTAGAASNTLVIQNDATAPLPIGTLCMFEQSTATGGVTVSPGSGVTLTGTLTTGVQYDVLMARKVAANSWRVTRVSSLGVSTGWTADSGTADKASHATYSAATISDPPTQAEVQALADALQGVSRGQKAIKDALLSVGIFVA